jgi:hypothetical protein
MVAAPTSQAIARRRPGEGTLGLLGIGAPDGIAVRSLAGLDRRQIPAPGVSYSARRPAPK